MQKSFEADLTQLYSMLDFIQGNCLHLPQEVINKVILASEEVAINIIRYSYPETTGKMEIKCDFSIEHSFFRVVFRDEGIAFNPLTEVCNPSFEKVGGLGIYLYKEMMDEIEYARVSEQNILTLTKFYIL